MDYSLVIAVALYFLAAGFGWALTWLNLRHLEEKGGEVPEEFKGHIDEGLLLKIRDYTVERSRLGLMESVLESVLTVLSVLFILKHYDAWVDGLALPFIVKGAVFFLILFYAGMLLSVPFSLYSTFVIEKKYGFSNMTGALWAEDLLKSLIISSVLSVMVICAGLWIVKASPGLWWLWLWGFFLAFSLFMMYLSPYVIEPLFNRFEEVDDEELKARIGEVLSRAGIRVAKVLKVDASRRTSHTNAYFTGIGSAKRIVLFDTLMRQLNTGELVSVLAHEAGHWKKRHLLKGIALLEAAGLAVFYISYRLIDGPFLEGVFDMNGLSFFAKALLLGFLSPIASLAFTPCLSWLSRRHEREADRYAVELAGEKDLLASALVKLSRDNLSNLHPHPLYAAFYYTHPPAVERVSVIKRAE